MSLESGPKTQPERPARPKRLPPGSPVGAGQFATAALAGITAVEAVAALTAIVTLARIPARRTEIQSAQISFTDGWEAGLGLAYAGVLVIAGVAWMIWQYQAHANLSALTKARYSPAVVWFYFVPVASLIIPYRAIRELASAGNDRPRLRRTWWGAFLLSNGLGGVGAVASAELSLTALSVLSLLSAVLGIVASVAAMRIIGLVNTGLWARRALAGWPPGPSPLSARAKLAWGIATGALTLVGAAGFGVLFPAFVESLEEAPRSTFDLAVGSCFNEGPGGYDQVSCAEPHYAEAYRIADHPDQAFYPGNDRVAEWAEPFCYSHFERYTGVAYQDSALEFGYLYPTEQSWNLGDREVVCFVFDLAGDDLISPVGPPVAEAAVAL